MPNHTPRPRPQTAEDWKQRGACRASDPALWEAEPNEPGNPEAVRVCTTCDVRTSCLRYALAYEERFGVWGGLCPSQRRRLASQIVPGTPLAGDAA